jgi:hypothetical protein
MSKKRIIALLGFLSLIILCTISAYYYYHNKAGSFHFTKNKQGLKRTEGHDRMKLTMDMGIDGRLGMIIAIPYEKTKQVGDLWRNYPRIVNDLNMQVSPHELKKWVINRDYHVIKAKLREIINNNIEEPINTIYFESFFYH